MKTASMGQLPVANQMLNKKPMTSLAPLSLGWGIFACIISLALPALYSDALHVEPTGVTAGLAVECYGLLSLTLGLSGVIFGITALRRIRRGMASGRGIAWSGIVLGCLPFLGLVVYLISVS
jgi:hypothetical protein